MGGVSNVLPLAATLLGSSNARLLMHHLPLAKTLMGSHTVRPSQIRRHGQTAATLVLSPSMLPPGLACLGPGPSVCSSHPGSLSGAATPPAAPPTGIQLLRAAAHHPGCFRSSETSGKDYVANRIGAPIRTSTTSHVCLPSTVLWSPLTPFWQNAYRGWRTLTSTP